VIELVAPAKLTVSLRVTGVRGDGYHLIDAEMVTLDLHDTLELRDGDALRISGPEADLDGGEAATGFARDNAARDSAARDNAARDNLVSRALAMVDRRADVHLIKRIPAGAGLGGGSADAAAVLHWAGFDDLDAAAALGADVAFCVRGGRARVRGIGEIVEPLGHVDRTFTLLTPPVRCATAAVYAAWDALGGPTGDHGNDLEPAALVVAPDLVRWRDELQAATGARPRLAGSGSTWFVEGAFPGPGRRVTSTVPRR